jgi:hypothetical protein
MASEWSFPFPNDSGAEQRRGADDCFTGMFGYLASAAECLIAPPNTIIAGLCRKKQRVGPI